VSMSTIDMTVSRCMKAWLWGTRWPPPWSPARGEQRVGHRLDAMGVIAHHADQHRAVAMTWTSPPSKLAGW